MALPEMKLTTVPMFATETCAVCGTEWEHHDFPPVPTWYTLASIDRLNSDEGMAEPVCDFCVEREDPGRFAELLADRQRFFAN